MKRFVCLVLAMSSMVFCFSQSKEEPRFGTAIRELSPKTRFKARKSADTLRAIDVKANIRIPRESLDVDTDIDVSRIELSYDRKAFTKMGDVYRFGPEGTAFGKGAEITLPYSCEDGYPEKFINIYYYNKATQHWDVMGKVSQDFENNTITARITHFSDYTPGVGSYFIEEGGTPNAAYFKNNQERVDTYTGTLHMNCTDLNIKGRGIDLVLERVFSSDMFFQNYASSHSLWNWFSNNKCNIEEEGYYKIARGWRFNLPALMSESGVFVFYSPSGTSYDLYNALSFNFPYPTEYSEYEMEGYRIYLRGQYKCIDILRENITVKTRNLTFFSGGIIPGEISINYPDGKKMEFYFEYTNYSGKGLIKYLYDASGKNKIEFKYDDSDKLDRIIDSTGKVFRFDHPTSDELRIFYDKNYSANSPFDPATDIALCKYSLSVNDIDDAVLEKIQRLDTDGSSLKEVNYSYSGGSSPFVEIEYPNDGVSRYEFDDRFHFCTMSFPVSTKPVSRFHTLRNSNGSSEYKKESYTWYTKQAGANMYEYFYAPSSSFCLIGKCVVDLSQNNDQNKRIQSTYTFQYDGYEIYQGTSKIEKKRYNGAGALESKPYEKRIYGYTNIVPEFEKPSSETLYTGNGTSDPAQRNKTEYVYDGYGQLEREKYIETINGASVNMYTYYDYISMDDPGYHNEFDNDQYESPNATASANWNNKLAVLTGIVKYKNSTIKQETYFKYDTKHNIVEISKKKTDFPLEFLTMGFHFETTYNNLDYITDPKGNIINLTYDANNAYIASDWRAIAIPNETRWDSGKYIVNKFEYDDLGRLDNKFSYIGTSYTDPASAIPGFTSDATYYTFDNLNRVTQVRTTSDRTNFITRKLYEYDDANNTLAVIDAAGNKTKKYYDGLDRLVTEETYKPVETPAPDATPDAYTKTSYRTYSYDPVYQNNVVSTAVFEAFSETDQESEERTVTQNTYDKLGRLVEVGIVSMTGPTPAPDATPIPTPLKKITYDDINNETLEQTYTDATGYTMKAVKKDWQGNTMKVSEWSAVSPATAPSPAPDIVTGYTYDYLGNCLSMTNPEQEITNYAYDVLNRLASITWPDTTTETIVYDANGNRDTFTDRNGDQTKYYYDSLNQVRTVETYSGTTEITSTTRSDYTQFGTPKEITGLDGDNTQEYKFTYSYDGLGRLTTYDQYTGTTADALHHAIANTYDASGVVDTMSVYEGPAGTGTLINALDFDPNDAGSSGDHGTVSTIRQLGAADPMLKMTNTFWGGLDTIEYGLNGTTPTITAQYGYDELLRPVSITGTKTTSGDLMQLGYTYDYQGNVRTWTGTSVIPRSFTYDGMNRLASETTTATTPNVTTSYTFDAMGNRTTLDKSNTTGTDTTYAYTAPNNSMRLMNDSTWTYEYDNNGNMTKKYKTGEYWFYFYDQYNRLRIAVLSTDNVFDYNDTIKGQYMYDANGLRILKIENGKTTVYIYSGQTLLFEETYNTENPSQLVAANRTLRELNIVAGSMNLAKYKWIPAVGWGQANAILHYHLLDHLGSRQVTTDVNGNAITDGNTEYATYGTKTAGAASETSFTGKKFDAGIGLYYFNARYYDSITGRFITQDPIKDGTNWYVYCENNPVSRHDSNGKSDYALQWTQTMGWTRSYAQVGAVVYALGTIIATLIDLGNLYGPQIPALVDQLSQFGGRVVEKGNEIIGKIGNYFNNMNPNDPKNIGDKIKSILNSIKNNIKGHLTKSDLEGAIKEMKGEITKINPKDSKPYDHIQEIENALRGVKNRIDEIKGLLNNEDLAKETKDMLQEILSETSKYVDGVEKTLAKGTNIQTGINYDAMGIGH